MWSRASKTVSLEGADLELDALTNRKPVMVSQRLHYWKYIFRIDVALVNKMVLCVLYQVALINLEYAITITTARQLTDACDALLCLAKP